MFTIEIRNIKEVEEEEYRTNVFPEVHVYINDLRV